MAMARTASEYNTGQTTSLTARCACGLTLLAWGEAKGRGRRALCHGRQGAAHSDACAVAVAQVKQQCAHKIQKVRSPIAHHRPPACPPASSPCSPSASFYDSVYPINGKHTIDG